MFFFAKFISNQSGSQYLSASLLIALVAVPFVAVEQNMTQTLEAAVEDRMSSTTVAYEAIEFNNDSSADSGCGCVELDQITTSNGDSVTCMSGWNCCPQPDSFGECHLDTSFNWVRANCGGPNVGSSIRFCRALDT